MGRGFGSNRRKHIPQQRRQQRTFANLKQHRDRILGLAWMGYCKYGTGAIHFKETAAGGEIVYIQREQIADCDVAKLVDCNDPTLAAIVLYEYSDRYDILTLSGPNKPPECYAKLSPHDTTE